MKNFEELFKEKGNFEINMKCENGKYSAKILGNKISLASALSSLVENLYNNGFSKDEIESSVKIGLKSQKEKEEIIKNKLDNIFNELFK